MLTFEAELRLGALSQSQICILIAAFYWLHDLRKFISFPCVHSLVCKIAPTFEG